MDRRGISLGRGAIGGGAVIVALVAALLGAPQSVVRSLLEGGGERHRDRVGADPQRRRERGGGLREGGPGQHRGRLDRGAAERPAAATCRPSWCCSPRPCSPPAGSTAAAVGPFYCPLDSRVYLDLSFFAELDRRFGAPGDFAQAYVVAHEVGHHVQNLLGISERVHAQRSRLPPAAGNRLSVATELQADCLAGVWAFHANRGGAAAGARRRRGGADGGRRDRRRHAAESGARAGRPRVVHARLVRGARALVQDAACRPAGSPIATPSRPAAL